MSDVTRFRFFEEPSGPLTGNELSGVELRLNTESLSSLQVMRAEGLDWARGVSREGDCGPIWEVDDPELSNDGVSGESEKGKRQRGDPCFDLAR